MPVAFPGGTLQTRSTRRTTELQVANLPRDRYACAGVLFEATTTKSEAEVEEIQVVNTYTDVLDYMYKNVQPGSTTLHNARHRDLEAVSYIEFFPQQISLTNLATFLLVNARLFRNNFSDSYII